MLKVNHECKIYIAYLFLGMLGTDQAPLPHLKEGAVLALTVVWLAGMLSFCIPHIRRLVCSSDLTNIC